MGEFLRVTIPLGVFMLCPIWLPLLGVALGTVLDRVRGEKVSPVQGAVRAAKQRSELARREAAAQFVGRRAVPVRTGHAHVGQADDSVAA